MNRNYLISEISSELDKLDTGTIKVLYRIICGEKGIRKWKRSTGVKLNRRSGKQT